LLSIRRVFFGGVAAGMIAALSGCGGLEPEDGESTLRVALASASGCGFDNVHLAIDSVQVHESPLATENSLGWRALKPAAPVRVDLMTLDNGVLADLGSATIPAGRYRKLRLALAPNTGSQPLRNSVTTPGRGEIALAMPAAQQAGLVLSIDRDAPADGTLAFVIDLDACASIVERAASGDYVLKPVLRTLPWPDGQGHSVAGRVANMPAGGGRIVRSTVADAQGRFLLSPAPAGTHDLVIVAQDRASAVLAGVPVAANARTTLVADDQPLSLVASTARTVSGRVGLVGTVAIPEAQASALQAVATRVVEIASRPVDALDGGYALRLPVGPPMHATFDAGATGYSFTPNIGRAGKYAIEAAVPGRAAQTVEVDITTGNAVVNFEFLP
jgi:hypothetical protein